MTIVLATHNKNKIAEYQRLLPHLNFITMLDLGLPIPDETGSSFVANALLKARAAWQACRRSVLADDAGFGLKALNGAPGVYAADWATRPDGQRDYNYAFARITSELQKLGTTFDQGCDYTVALVYIDAAGCEHIFTTTINGTLCLPPRGGFGFGYDPLFIPDGQTQTYAEMPAHLRTRTDICPRAKNCAQLSLLLKRAA